MRLDVIPEINVAYLVRYLVLTGIVVLVQNYASSFPEERRSVWNAPPSFTKYSFLITRHLPIFCGIIGFVPVSGFRGLLLSDDVCGWIFCLVTVLITASLAINNILATLHVVTLWDYNKTILRSLSAAFGLSYSGAIVFLSVGLANMKSGMIWNPLLDICVVSSVSGWMVAAAATPLAFELVMLVSVCVNSFDRPRAATIPLRRALVSDGIVFFVCTTMFRTIQLALVATRDPGLAILGLLSVSFTCLVSIIFNQRAFARQRLGVVALGERYTRSSTPLSVSQNQIMTRRLDASNKSQWSQGNVVELGRVDVELHHD